MVVPLWRASSPIRMPRSKPRRRRREPSPYDAAPPPTSRRWPSITRLKPGYGRPQKPSTAFCEASRVLHLEREARAMSWSTLLVASLPPTLADFERRGFRTTPGWTRATLESAAGAFLDGYRLERECRLGEMPNL